MADLFGVDIAGILNDAMGGGLLKGTLIQVTTNTRTPRQLTGGHILSGNAEKFNGYADLEYRGRNGTLIDGATVEVAILGGSLSVGVEPQVGDQVLIDGGQYTLLEIRTDPAKAMYLCPGARLQDDPVPTNALLLESKGFLLLESGGLLLLEN